MRTACVILAAGLGKRMRSSRVKVLHPVCGQPMIDYPVSLALKRRCDPVVVVVGHQGQRVIEHLRDRFGERVRFAMQKAQRGTAHAVLRTQPILQDFCGKLVILYGDGPLLSASELEALHRAGRGCAVAFLTCRLRDPGRYGRVIRDARGEVERIVEFADASRAERRIEEINTGIYLVDLPFALEVLKTVRRGNAQGEYYLTDLIRLARERGQRVRGIEAADADAVLGINDRLELARSERILNQRLVHALIKRGVTAVDPSHTYVGAEVRIGADSVLLPGCVLRGRVRIGTGCTLGPGAVITDARIADGVEVRAYSVLERCRIGPGAVVGPFARLRPGTVVEAEARVGNFVEVKKTTLGKGSQANHFSYLGDATVGAGVNVGAGTITCNYDGVEKRPTEIADRAFIGSGSELVAPVKVGVDAYVGAGTTVTRDVPDRALAISRVQQRNVEDFAKRKRRKGRGGSKRRR